MTSAVYQHNFADVKDYLHHRAPYLMVGAIESIGDRYQNTKYNVFNSFVIKYDEHH